MTLGAAFLGLFAAGRKCATGGRRDQIGRQALDRRHALGNLIRPWRRLQESLSVRVNRQLENILSISDLENFACIHHGDPVT